MEGQTSTYRYDPLNEAKREIRLLRLLRRPIQQPGDPPANDIILCHFSCASLDETLDFEALSYVWGDPKDVVPIELEGQKFFVTANLHCALRHLRLKSRERIVWIDALCINQNDNIERTSQVAQMRYIYSLASTVVVFLGDMWRSCDIAMDFMETMAAEPSPHLDPNMDSHVVINGANINSDALREHIAEFFNAPWFHRTWTVQEYTLAQRVNFQCGSRSMDGDYYERALEAYYKHITSCCMATTTTIFREISNNHSLGTRINNVYDLNRIRQTPDYCLKYVAMLFKTRRAYDPRDKIYGLLGIVRENSIQADYNSSTKDVFTGVVTSSIREDQSLAILSYRYGTRDPAFEIPSFVPDWTSYVEPVNESHFQRRMHIVDSGFYDACKGRKPEFALVSPSEAASKCIIMDIIQEIDRSRKVVCWQEMAARCHKQADLGNKTPYTSQEGAFVETMCCGMTYHSDHYRRWEDGDYPAYLAWKAWIDSECDASLFNATVGSFNTPCLTTSVGRNFIVTRKGYIGWAPKDAEVGDLVVVMPGGKVPYILRLLLMQSESEPTDATAASRYTFIGDAYIHGIMQGAAYDEEKLESIILV